MATFAEIKNGVVINIIVADTKEIAELVTQSTCAEYTDSNPAAIGWNYSDGTFMQPSA